TLLRLSQNNIIENKNCDDNDIKVLSKHDRKRIIEFNLNPLNIQNTIKNIPEIINNNCNDLSNIIGGLDKPIKILKECILIPLLYPDLFLNFKLKLNKG